MMSNYRFICLDCKCEFDNPERVEESRGEFWGMPCSETMLYCPNCGSEAFYETDEIDDEEEDEEDED